MTDFVLGPGVAAAIEAAGDEARSDERFIILGPEGCKVSMTIARDGIWYWVEEDNRTSRTPFEVAAPPDTAPVYDPWTSQPAQLYDWTCSAASLDWLKRAMWLVVPSDIYESRESTVYEIGYPGNINPTYGLMDSSGSALRAVLSDYGVGTLQGWLDYDTAYAIAAEGPGMCSGAAWYHWVGIRGVSGDCLAIANSAPGYKGVYDTLSRSQFNALGGFSVVWVV